MIRVNQIFYYGFVFILLLIFLLGGVLQYFIGIPSTTYTLIVLAFIYVLIIFNIMITGKVFFNKVLLVSSFYIGIIIISGIVNDSDIKKIILYQIFPLIPLGVFQLITILKRRNIDIHTIVSSLFKIVVLIQLPLILIQKFGYSFLIKLNNSNQVINDYDFMFGSFFIRADHSLGFFLLLYALNIIFRIKRGELKKTPWFILIYIVVTIFIMESNLTKLILILVVSYYLFRWIYHKFNLLGIVLMFFTGSIMFSIALTVPAIDAQYQYVKTKYTPGISLQAFQKKYAKRPQVVIAYATHFRTKWIGEGPYDYFDIFKGEFKQTQHFSQLIWTYNDLGLFGIFIVILVLYNLIKSLSLDFSSAFLLTCILLLYLFLTNIYSDLAMLFSLLLLPKEKINIIEAK